MVVCFMRWYNRPHSLKLEVCQLRRVSRGAVSAIVTRCTVVYKPENVLRRPVHGFLARIWEISSLLPRNQELQSLLNGSRTPQVRWHLSQICAPNLKGPYACRVPWRTD